MTASKETESQQDRRRFERVNVRLNGRMMLSDRSEYQCLVADMSPVGAAIQTEAEATVGERVITYADHVGRLEGRASRLLPDGFAVELNTPPIKREKIIAQLSRIARKLDAGSLEDRRHDRIAPLNPDGVLFLEDGRHCRCRIADLSLSGAALELRDRPEIGTVVTLGRMRGQVVRHLEDGIAIEFAVIQRPHTLNEHLRLPG
jgi:hypothetical protein